jgi:2'-5' RNA ligase
MAHRTFLALDIGDDVRQALATLEAELTPPQARIRWVRPENLHVTVRFLGDVSDAVLADVCQRSASAVAGVERFSVDITGVRCVPARGPVRMIWAGVDDPSGRLAEVYRRLDEALAGLPVQRERRAYRPHVTLARVKHVPSAGSLRQAVQARAGRDFGSARGREITVYTSRLTPQGSVYTPVSKAIIGG